MDILTFSLRSHTDLTKPVSDWSAQVTGLAYTQRKGNRPYFSPPQKNHRRLSPSNIYHLRSTWPELQFVMGPALVTPQLLILHFIHCKLSCFEEPSSSPQEPYIQMPTTRASSIQGSQKNTVVNRKSLKTEGKMHLQKARTVLCHWENNSQGIVLWRQRTNIVCQALEICLLTPNLSLIT